MSKQYPLKSLRGAFGAGVASAKASAKERGTVAKYAICFSPDGYCLHAGEIRGFRDGVYEVECFNVMTLLLLGMAESLGEIKKWPEDQIRVYVDERAMIREALACHKRDMEKVSGSQMLYG